MKRDLVFILIDGDGIQVFGNLKTLLEEIKAERQYSTVWRLLEKGEGEAEFGAFRIKKAPVIRAPYATR